MDDEKLRDRESGDFATLFKPRREMCTRPSGQSNTERKVLPDGGSEASPDQIEEIANKADTDPASVIGEVTTLTVALDNPDSSVRENAVDALYDIAKHDPDAVTPAVSALSDCFDDEDSIMSTALNTLYSVSKYNPNALEKVVDDVVAMMEDTGGPIIPMRAAATLEQVFKEKPEATENVVQQLYDVVSDPDETADDRTKAADKLAVLGIRQMELLDPVLPELFTVLSTDDPDIKERTVYVANSVEADGEYADALADHEPALRSLLNHDDKHVREQAYEALSTIGVAVEPPEEIAADSSSEK